MSEKFLKVGGTDGTIARGLKTNVKGELIVDGLNVSESNVATKLDFKGKIKGKTNVPSLVKVGYFSPTFSGERLTSPTPITGGWEEVSQGAYNLLNRSKIYGFSESTTDSGKTPFLLVSFNVREHLIANGEVPHNWTNQDVNDKIENFDFLFYGRGGSPSEDGVTIHAWNGNTNSFFNGTRKSDVSESVEITYSVESIGQTYPMKMVDDDGFIHFVIRSNGTSDGVAESLVVANELTLQNVKFKKGLLTTDVSKALDVDAIRTKFVGENLAYNPEKDLLKVSVEESTLRDLLENYIRYERQPTFVETIFEGELDADEYLSKELYSYYRGEKETRILVSTDQEGFRMIIGAGPLGDADGMYTGNTYPSMESYTSAHTEIKPLHVLPIYGNAEAVASWTEAYQHRQLNNFRIAITNTASEKANVIIKIMRIFK